MESSHLNKGTKRKYEPTFASEIVIDNRAPLQKLVYDLYGRGTRYSKTYRYYRQLLAQRHSTIHDRLALHCALPGHPLNAFSDDYDGDINYGYFEEFTYKSLMPHYITKLRNIEKSDPVVELLKAKAKWKHELVGLKNLCCSLEVRSKIERLNEDVIHCPKYLLDLAAILENAPDRHFDDSYNWYYAGSGNLQLICISWVDYLLHSEFSSVYVTRFYKDTMTVDFEESVMFDCDHNILETICSPDNIIALRTKHKIFLLKVKELDAVICLEELKSFTSDLSFTSIAFDKHHKNILYVTTLDCKLYILNLDRMTHKCVILRKRVTLENNWNRVIGATRGTYMHIERKGITAYDKRTNSTVTTWQGVIGVVDEVDCNILSVAEQLEDSHRLYFTTNHHLFLMDARCSKTRNLKPLQRWTHGMQCVPTYISVCSSDHNKELVFLSSQWCEDICIVSSYSDRLERARDIDGVSIPYRPPSILNALHEARQQLLCWDIQNPVDGRLVTSITGKLEVQTGENYTILMQNALGDMSSHVMFPSYMQTFMDDDSVQNLHEWSKSYKIPRNDFEVSEVSNIANVWKQLRTLSSEYEGFSFLTQSVPKEIDKEVIYNAYENEELMPELLDAWLTESDKKANETADLNVSTTNTG